MKKLLHVLLSFLFTRDVFSYQKLLQVHEDELFKITGTHLIKKDFLYLLPYNKYVREVIWSLKFKNNRHAARLFGRLLYETLPEYLIRWEQFEGFTDPLLLTVPSSKKSLRLRGYNPTDVMLKSFLAHGGSNFVTYKPNALSKVKHTIKQSHTRSKKERLTNPKGAFAIADAHLPTLKGRNVVLFDDVLTTGATTNEIKRALKKAGASQIKVVVITH